MARSKKSSSKSSKKSSAPAPSARASKSNAKSRKISQPGPLTNPGSSTFTSSSLQDFVKTATCGNKIAIFAFDFGTSDFVATSLQKFEKYLEKASKKKKKSSSSNTKDLYSDVGPKTFSTSESQEFSSDLNFLFDSKTIRSISKIVALKSGIFAVVKSEFTFKLVNSQEDSRLGFFDADVFCKKAEKAAQKEMKKSAKSVAKTKTLVNYQNFQYRLAKIRDQMKQLRLKAKVTKNKPAKNAHKIKIMFTSLASGGSKLIETEESQTLRSCLDQAGCVNCSNIKTFWPDQSYQLDKRLNEYPFLKLQVLYVEGDHVRFT